MLGYREHGTGCLINLRKPAFSPKARRSRVGTLSGNRWIRINEHELRSLGHVPWLEGLSLSSDFSRLFSYKRAREYLRSPDTDYAEKLSRIKQALEEARENPETCVVVYQDEFSFNLRVAKDLSFGARVISQGDLLWHRGAQPTHRRFAQKLHGCRTPYILHPDLPTLKRLTHLDPGEFRAALLVC